MVYNYYTGALIAILSVETTEEKRPTHPLKKHLNKRLQQHILF